MVQVYPPNLAAPFNVTNAAWLEHFQAHLKADMSSHRGRRRTTTFGESVIAFSSKQGQPVRPKLFKIMVKVRLPREPYEGQIYYDPDNELIFLFENGRWIDVTDLDIVKTEF